LMTRVMVKDAIHRYLESLVKHGEEIPIEPSPASIGRVAINL
jgi:predicted RNase H-like HicB family nuclease